MIRICLFVLFIFSVLGCEPEPLTYSPTIEEPSVNNQGTKGREIPIIAEKPKPKVKKGYFIVKVIDENGVAVRSGFVSLYHNGQEIARESLDINGVAWFKLCKSDYCKFVQIDLYSWHALNLDYHIRLGDKVFVFDTFRERHDL